MSEHVLESFDAHREFCPTKGCGAALVRRAGGLWCPRERAWLILGRKPDGSVLAYVDSAVARR